MLNKPNLTFKSECNVWNDRPQLIACEQVQVTNWRSSVHHLPEQRRIVHIVPKNATSTGKGKREHVEYIFHQDKDPYFEVSRTSVSRRHFLHAMIARERYSSEQEPCPNESSKKR